MNEISTRPRHTGIRLIRLRQDLIHIADLIETCFAENLDAEGRDYIRHIRQTAQNFSGFILEDTTPENSSLPFNGYVWEEDGQIIGNLTLIPLRKKEKGSYFIANVAVDPRYRGRGIGKKLTERAMQHVREHQGKQIFLQVRSDNDTAVHIYQAAGFEEFARRTTWIYRPPQNMKLASLADIKITSRKTEDWQQQALWLQENYPKDITWNLPYQLEKFAPTFNNWLNRFLNIEFQKTWVARNQDKIIGTVTFDRCNEVHDFLWIGASPAWENEVILSLIPFIQHRVLSPHRLAVNYPAGRGRSAFQASGMTELNTLIWMKYKVYPTDERFEIRL